MNGKVEQVGAKKFKTNGEPFFTLKIGREWFNMSGDETDQDKVRGRMINYTVTSPKKDKFNGWIKVDAVEEPVVERANPVEAPIGSNVFRLPTWDDYANIMRSAHQVALELEPDHLKPHTTKDGDEYVDIAIDRSAARATIVNTVIIAFSKGSIAVPEDESPF